MVVWVVSGAASTGGSGMQKAAAVRAYGEGEQQQAGMAVSWHQEGARECAGWSPGSWMVAETLLSGTCIYLYMCIYAHICV